MPIPGEDDNILKNFRLHKNEKSTLKKQDIEDNHTNWVGKSSDTENHVRHSLSEHTP